MRFYPPVLVLRRLDSRVNRQYLTTKILENISLFLCHDLCYSPTHEMTVWS